MLEGESSVAEYTINLSDFMPKRQLTDDEIRQRERNIFGSKYIVSHNVARIYEDGKMTWHLGWEEPDDEKYLIVNGRPLTCPEMEQMLEYGEEIGIERFKKEVCYNLRTNVRAVLLECLENRLKNKNKK